MAIQQLLLGLGAAGESYWIKSITHNGTNPDTGAGMGSNVMSADGTDDGDMFFTSSSQSGPPWYPSDKDGVHIYKFDKEGTISARQSLWYAMGYKSRHTSMDSDGNMYIGIYQGKFIKLNSSFAEQVSIDIDAWDFNGNTPPLQFDGDYMWFYGSGGGHDDSSHGRSFVRKLSKSTLEGAPFSGSTSNDTRGLFRFSNTANFIKSGSKFYMSQRNNYVGNSAYHQLILQWDGTWNNSSEPFDKNNDIDWLRRLSGSDGGTSQANNKAIVCMTVDNGDVYAGGLNGAYGDGSGSWNDYGSRNFFGKINSSGTTQWMSNIQRSANGDGLFSFGRSYTYGGGPFDLSIQNGALYALCFGKNNTQTNKSGDKHDFTIAKLNKDTGAYISSYSICNETDNWKMGHNNEDTSYNALWTDKAVYFSTTVDDEDRTLLLKLPIDGGINGTYTLSGQTIKISDNSLSQGNISSSNLTFTDQGSNTTDLRSGLSNAGSSSWGGPTYHQDTVGEAIVALN